MLKRTFERDVAELWMSIRRVEKAQELLVLRRLKSKGEIQLLPFDLLMQICKHTKSVETVLAIAQVSKKLNMEVGHPIFRIFELAHLVFNAIPQQVTESGNLRPHAAVHLKRERERTHMRNRILFPLCKKFMVGKPLSFKNIEEEGVESFIALAKRSDAHRIYFENSKNMLRELVFKQTQHHKEASNFLNNLYYGALHPDTQDNKQTLYKELEEATSHILITGKQIKNTLEVLQCLNKKHNLKVKLPSAHFRSHAGRCKLENFVFIL